MESLCYLGDRVLRDATKTSIQLQMFSASQQVTDGVELWTVTHQLVDAFHFCQNAEDQKN